METVEIIQKPSFAIPADRERYFQELYEAAFPNVARMVARSGGSFQNAKDIFHDSLIIFFEKVTLEAVQIQVSPEAYVFGIAKHLCLKNFRLDKRQVSLEQCEQEVIISEDFDETPDRDAKILRLLERAGKRCMELLTAFYYENLKVSDLVKTFGFSSDHSASAQKFKCLEKVRNVIEEKSLNYEDFE